MCDGVQISESSDALRDLGATIAQTNLASGDNRQNQAMKRVGNRYPYLHHRDRL